MPSPGIVVRFRPVGPWRIGPHTGVRDSVDPILHSDSLFSALSCSMRQLGFLPDWLRDTAESSRPEVRLSSAFPYAGQNLYVPPPRHTWPPGIPGKVRWKAARLIPLSLTPVLLRDEDPDQERWAADPVSLCLLPVGKHGVSQPPFRIGLRSTAPVDRITGTSSEAHLSACLEFTPGSGMWCLVAFNSDEARERWSERIRAAFRLLADSGIGGERSRGWGRSRQPQFQDLDISEFLPSISSDTEGEETAYWLLSLFSPGAGDKMDWHRGDYTVVTRSGRVENGGELKQASRLIEEGSVVFAGESPVGAAVNVAPAGAAHPVYRSGFAVSVRVPVRAQGVKYRSAFAVPEPEPEPPPVEEPPEPEPPIEEPAPEPPEEEQS